MPKLTDLFIDKLPLSKERVTHWDALLPAFGIRVGARSKTFLVIDSAGSRRKLGAYPAMKLSEARDAARTYMQGTPTPATTYTNVLEAYVSQHLWKNCRPANAKELERILRKHFAFTGPIAEISKRDVAVAIEAIQAPSAANHATVAVKMLFNWAERRGYLDRSPIDKLPKPFKASSRAHTLTDDELRRIWQAAKTLGRFGCIIQLCILTAQRRGELAKMKAEWLKDDLLVIPGNVTKNGKPHSLLLTKRAQQICLTFVKYTGPTFSAWSKSKARLDRLSNTTGHTIHDLRRSASSRLAQLGVAPHVIERGILNHSAPASLGGDIGAIYNRHSYLQEATAALSLYEQHLETAIGPL